MNMAALSVWVAATQGMHEDNIKNNTTPTRPLFPGPPHELNWDSSVILNSLSMKLHSDGKAEGKRVTTHICQKQATLCHSI